MGTWLALLTLSSAPALAADDTQEPADTADDSGQSGDSGDSEDDTGSSISNAYGAAWHAGEEGCSTVPGSAAAGLGLIVLGGLLLRRREESTPQG